MKPKKAAKKKKAELKIMPHSAAVVLNITRNENFSQAELYEVLKSDPALATKILKHSNSAVNGSGAVISDLNQAAVLLGPTAVAMIALSSRMYDLTRNSCMDKKRFWKHSIQTSIIANKIAEAVSYPNPSDAYVCGLIHDIGLLLWELKNHDNFEKLWERVKHGESITRAEEDFGVKGHDEIAAIYLKKNNLPSHICFAVRQHHQIVADEEPEKYPQLSQIVALANYLACYKIPNEHPSSILDPKVLERMGGALGLDPQRLHELERNSLTETVETANQIEMEVGSWDEILIDASRIVFKQNFSMLNSLARYDREGMSSGIKMAINDLMNRAKKEVFDRYRAAKNMFAELKQQDHDDQEALVEELENLKSNMSVYYFEMKEVILQTDNDIQAIARGRERPEGGYEAPLFETGGCASAEILNNRNNEPLTIGKNYVLEVCVSKELPRGLHLVHASSAAQRTNVAYDVCVESEDLRVFPAGKQTCECEPDKTSNTIRFLLTPEAAGDQNVNIEFMRDEHWSARIEIPVNVSDPNEKQQAGE